MHAQHLLNERADPLTEDVLRHNFTDNNLMQIMNYYMTGDNNPDIGDAQHPQDIMPERYNGKLLLVPGAYSLDWIDEEMEGNTDPSIPCVQTNRYIGAFRKMINDHVKKFVIDVVLVDCAPANSRLNKIFAMTADFIIPPVFPDYYSMASVHGLLSHVLPNWFEWREQV